mmetsp:Transcript_1847/g.5584  ORF Transcript_1847/g.5584 Transcript_1847/m.5584 type:complete len:213 (-) Transcript_1847:2112-2750(-)
MATIEDEDLLLTKPLLEEDVGGDPIEQFAKWFDEAKSVIPNEPNAMCLATCTADGFPSARMVLLKDFDESGFVWYTNYDSRKATELKDNPRAALVFWWKELARSVRIEGSVELVPAHESDKYFKSRALGSQLAASVSHQSQPISSRCELDKRYTEAEANLRSGQELNRPEFWGGFRLAPRTIEFWKSRTSRLHDRLKYVRSENSWKIVRLQP